MPHVEEVTKGALQHGAARRSVGVDRPVANGTKVWVVKSNCETRLRDCSTKKPKRLQQGKPETKSKVNPRGSVRRTENRVKEKNPGGSKVIALDAIGTSDDSSTCWISCCRRPRRSFSSGCGRRPISCCSRPRSSLSSDGSSAIPTKGQRLPDRTTVSTKSDHTTLAHWQFAQAHSIGVLGSLSVRISYGLI